MFASLEAERVQMKIYEKFAFVFWDVLPFKQLSTNVSEVRSASIIAL
jgi:hypothetical protein